MSFNFVPFADSLSFSGDTLILPAVSHGNVGQLAIELLINTLGAERTGANLKITAQYHLWVTGVIDTRAVLPIVGGGCYDAMPGQLVTAIEVYRSSEHKVTIIQQRSPLLKASLHQLLPAAASARLRGCRLVQGAAQSFAHDLVQWIVAAGFAKAFVLSSADAAYRIDAEINTGTQLGYVANESCADSDAFVAAGFSVLRQADGLWVSKSSFSSCVIAAAEEVQIPASVVVSICYEGDNVPNAIALAGSFAAVLGVTIATSGKTGLQLKIPPSWKHIQGEPLPAGLQDCGMY